MSKLTSSDIGEILEEAYHQYATPDFIEHDPIQVPKKFTKKEDIEIAAFLTSTIAWGQRKTIIRNAEKIMQWMDYAPHDFILNHTIEERKPFEAFVHRTFNGTDLSFFLQSLQSIYLTKGGLSSVFQTNNNTETLKESIIHFREAFFAQTAPQRTSKHVSNPEKGSASKRLVMFLRWMVRPDKEGIDFGLWSHIKPSDLLIPLDVHTSNVGRKLSLLHRKQNDWKAVVELSSTLAKFNPEDPIKYDLALFGLGVSGTLR